MVRIGLDTYVHVHCIAYKHAGILLKLCMCMRVDLYKIYYIINTALEFEI